MFTIYFIIALCSFIFFANDAANAEARFRDIRLHYSQHDWLLVVVGSFLWLPVIFIGITYGLLFTMYYQVVEYKRKKIEKERETGGAKDGTDDER